MKKKLGIVAGIILTTALVCNFIMPQIILAVDKQEKIAEEYAYSEYFFTEYEEVRSHFLDSVQQMEEKGYAPQMESYAIDETEGLYIDSLYVPSTEKAQNLIVLTTGVHGIEGYIGSVMLDVFWNEVYPGLNPKNTGVLVVANVNPYGMKYHRRYNENNVDLNRNFILDWDNFDRMINKDYPFVYKFLGPEKQIGNAFWHELGFYGTMVKQILTHGVDKISNALTGGQYEYPEGVYYGGMQDEASTVYLKDVFKRTLDSSYENIVHIDIHSGYGPRYNMVIFNSIYETMNEAETKELFGYDNVISYDSESFYPTTGDTTDFYYRLWEQMGKKSTLFSTCFEFGTLGDGFFDVLRAAHS